jgi:hypothetical protein
MKYKPPLASDLRHQLSDIMNINRHNYEEYFILYMDNELSSDQRRMVEAFIQNNPDLKNELDNLLQYKLEPDTAITYQGKEALLALTADGIKEETGLSLHNYEEWLVLYADNELTPAQRAQVGNFVLTNPVAAKELSLLQKSRLQPDNAIVFAHKEILYRKEEKVRALLPRWWKYAAAAVLLLAAGLTTVLITSNKNNGTTPGQIVKGTNKEVVPVNPATPGTKNTVAGVKEEISPVTNPQTPDNFVKEQSAAPDKLAANAVLQKNNSRVQQQQPVIEQTPLKKNEPVVADQNKPSNNLPAPLQNPNVNKVTTDAIANVDVKTTLQQSPDALTNPVVTKTNTPPSDFKHASIKENVSDPDTDLADGSKKNKLRGFFRKVTRTFEKRTNIDATNGDDKLLIAGLSFKLK